MASSDRDRGIDRYKAGSGSRPRGFGLGPIPAIALVLFASVVLPMLRQDDPTVSRIEFPKDGVVTSVAFGPSGDRFISDHRALGPMIVRVDPQGGLRRGPAAGVSEASRIAVDPKGRFVVMALDSGAIELRDPDNLGLLRALPGHESRVMDLAISADGRRLVSVDRNGIGRTWSIDEGRLEWEHREARGLSRCAVSPDGSSVVLGSRSGEIAVFEGETGGELARWDAHGHDQICLSLAFTPDGRLLAGIGLDGRLRTWDASADWSSRLVVRMPGGTSGSLSIAPDGRSVATGHNDGRVRFWDLAGGDQVGEADLGRIQLSSVSYAPDGKRLAAAIGSEVALVDVPGSV